MKNIANIFQQLPEDLPEEMTEVISAGKRVRIERIISRGHSSPRQFWYDQAEDEFVLLLKGEAILQFKDQNFEDQNSEIRLSMGDYLTIPAHVPHRVHWTKPEEDTIWLAVFF